MSFEEVFVEFRPKIGRYIIRLVGSAEADDVIQAVFTRIHEALPGFRQEASLATWVYRIATNAAIDHLRQRTSRAEVTEPIDDDEIVESAPTPEDLAAQAEIGACIMGYVDKLPLDWRTVLVLSEHEGLTNQEIADALGVTLDNIKIRLHRARARLKSLLQGGCRLYRDQRNVLTCEPKPQPVSFRR